MLRGALDVSGWRAPGLPVVANYTAEPYRDVVGVPVVLERQLSAPVRWADCVRRLRALGCDRFVEVGPKRALTGMMRELVPDAGAQAVSSPEAARALQPT